MAKVNSLKQVEKAVPKYDPNKNYRWDPSDEFVLSGLDFAKLYNTLQSLATLPTDIPPIDKVNCFRILEDLLKKAVEEGVAVPTDTQL